MLGQGARREGGERGQAQPFAFAGSSGEMARDGRGKLDGGRLAQRTKERGNSWFLVVYTVPAQSLGGLPAMRY